MNKKFLWAVFLRFATFSFTPSENIINEEDGIIELSENSPNDSVIVREFVSINNDFAKFDYEAANDMGHKWRAILKLVFDHVLQPPEQNEDGTTIFDDFYLKVHQMIQARFTEIFRFRPHARLAAPFHQIILDLIDSIPDIVPSNKWQSQLDNSGYEIASTLVQLSGHVCALRWDIFNSESVFLTEDINNQIEKLVKDVFQHFSISMKAFSKGFAVVDRFMINKMFNVFMEDFGKMWMEVPRLSGRQTPEVVSLRNSCLCGALVYERLAILERYLNMYADISLPSGSFKRQVDDKIIRDQENLKIKLVNFQREVALFPGFMKILFSKLNDHIKFLSIKSSESRHNSSPYISEIKQSLPTLNQLSVTIEGIVKAFDQERIYGYFAGQLRHQLSLMVKYVDRALVSMISAEEVLLTNESVSFIKPVLSELSENLDRLHSSLYLNIDENLLKNRIEASGDILRACAAETFLIDFLENGEERKLYNEAREIIEKIIKREIFSESLAESLFKLVFPKLIKGSIRGNEIISFFRSINSERMHIFSPEVINSLNNYAESVINPLETQIGILAAAVESSAHLKKFVAVMSYLVLSRNFLYYKVFIQ